MIQEIKPVFFFISLGMIIFLLLPSKRSPYGIDFNWKRKELGIVLLDSNFQEYKKDGNTSWRSNDASQVYQAKYIVVQDTISQEVDEFVIKENNEIFIIQKHYFYSSKIGNSILFSLEGQRKRVLLDTCYSCLDSVLNLREPALRYSYLKRIFR